MIFVNFPKQLFTDEMDKMRKTIADSGNSDLGRLVYGNTQCLGGRHDNLKARLPNEPFKLHRVNCR